jgi:hypothetical protein
MRGDSRRQAGEVMVRSVRLVENAGSVQSDRRAKRLLSQEQGSQLAEAMAELTYLDHLEAVRESNVASLRRLKHACDTLLERGLGRSSATLPPDLPQAKDEPARQ